MTMLKKNNKAEILMYPQTSLIIKPSKLSNKLDAFP